MAEIMEIRVQDKKAKPLSGVEPALAEVLARLQKHPEAWLEKLRADPGSFADLEKSVHRAFQEMADQVVAGLLAEVTGPAGFAETAQKK
jgi:hypothetical protein